MNGTNNKQEPFFFKYTQKIGFFGSSVLWYFIKSSLIFFQAKCAVESLCVSHSKFTCIKGINTVKCSAGVYFQNIQADSYYFVYLEQCVLYIRSKLLSSVAKKHRFLGSLFLHTHAFSEKQIATPICVFRFYFSNYWSVIRFVFLPQFTFFYLYIVIVGYFVVFLLKHKFSSITVTVDSIARK